MLVAYVPSGQASPTQVSYQSTSIDLNNAAFHFLGIHKCYNYPSIVAYDILPLEYTLNT